MKVYLSKTLIAGIIILLAESFETGSQLRARTETMPCALTDFSLVDSLKKAFKEAMELKTANPALAGRRYGRRRSPDGEFVISTVIPWDGESEIDPDSVYSHTQEQEEKFTKAMLKALIPNNLPEETKNEMKNIFLESLQEGLKDYIQHVDSIYQYKDSLYQALKSVDVDSL